MKQIKRIMIVVLALVLAVSLSLTAFAATASQDGLELSVTTDKTSYSATEQVTVTITVKNTNAFAVSNVAVESNVPDGYKPADGYSSTKNIATLGAGETATLTVVYVPQNSGQPSSPSYPTYPPYPWYSGNTSNTSDAEETEEVVEIDQPTEGNTNVFEEVTVTAKRNVGLWVLIAVVSAGALIAVLAGKKRLKKTMSIMLCIAMVGTLAAVLPVEVNAAVMPIEAGGVKSLSAETEISVAGKNVNVSASVQYVLDSENPNPITYTVTFEANGENVENLPETQKVKEGECAIEPIAPSREGFDFTGWYTDEKAETPFDFSSKITSDIVLYAGWKEIVKPDVYYTVTFDANGENVENLPEPQKVKEGECIVEPVAPSREGFDFTGWYTDKAAETPFDFSSKITSDIVLYAGWKEIVKPDVYYTVAFEANGENVKNLPEPQKVKEGECAVEPIAPSREGFDFTGWYTDETAETLFDFSFKITGDIVLYAGWKLIDEKIIISDEVYATVPEYESIVQDESTGNMYISNELIIHAKATAERDMILEMIKKYDAVIIGEICGINTYQVRLKKAYNLSELSEIINELNQNPLVDWTNYNYAFHNDVDYYPLSDTEWSNDWFDSVPEGLNWGVEAIRAPQAWDFKDKMTSTTKVGIYDIYFYSHDDLTYAKKTNTVSEERVGFSSHGTHVAGTIAAGFDNNVGISGVSPNTSLYAYSYTDMYHYNENGQKVYVETGFVFQYEMALYNLIETEKCRVVNISQNTGRLECFAASRGNLNAINYVQDGATELERYLQLLVDKGNDFVLCVAAGNVNGCAYVKDDNAIYGYVEYNAEEPNGQPISGGALAKYNNFLNYIESPEIKSRIIVVGACGQDEEETAKYKFSYFSNIDDRIDVVAPGEKIHSTIRNNGYDILDGTSMATPHVSGLAAMLLSSKPELTGAQVKAIIKNTANIPVDGCDYKMINAEAAVKNALKIVYGDVYERGTNNLIYDAKATLTGLTEDKQAIEVSEYAHAGSFEIRIPNDMVSDIKLTVSCDGYEDYVYPLGISPNTSTDVGDIYLEHTPIKFNTALSGIVIDSDQGVRLEGVEVSVYDETDTNLMYAQTTDENGYFYIGIEVAGNYVVHFDKEGYDTIRKEIYVIDSLDNSMGFISLNDGSSYNFSGGDGTKDNPYLIETAEQLNAVRNDMSANYVLSADIDLSNYGSWDPIGTVNKRFTGSLDGNNHKIIGLTINNDSVYKWATDNNGPADQYTVPVGLFGILGSKASVRNIVFENYTVSVGNTGYVIYSGAVAGYLYINSSNITISNCIANGTITLNTGDDFGSDVGGIVGAGVWCTATISNCINNAPIDVSGYGSTCGGIAGYMNNATIELCVNNADVQGLSEGSFSTSGGIIGNGTFSTVSKCDNFGNISTRAKSYTVYTDSENSVAGGIAGSIERTIDSCNNYGDVYAEHDVVPSAAGGICGEQLHNSDGYISNCTNYGKNIKAVYRSWIDKDKGLWEYKYGYAARICGYAKYFNEGLLRDNKSISTTIVNGAIPTEHIGPNEINGESIE